MKLFNATRGALITQDVKIATSFFDQLFGLLNKDNPRTLIFFTRFGIHTFFMKEPIDILILDRDWKIVKVKENLKPNSLFFWKPIYPIVIEMPVGYIKKFKLVIGDSTNTKE